MNETIIISVFVLIGLWSCLGTFIYFLKNYRNHEKIAIEINNIIKQLDKNQEKLNRLELRLK